MQQYDMIVVGAGISGMSMAHYCARQGMRTLVLEKDGRLGGCIHSHHFTDSENGFWAELGAHTCFNSYGNLLEIMGDCGLLNQLQPREKLPYKMLVDGELKSIPSQLHFPELLLRLPRLFTSNKAGKSVAEYYGNIVGPRNYQEVFSQAFNAVLCQPADDVPAEMLFRKRPRRKDVLRSFTLAGGLQTIIDTIVQHSGIEHRTGLEVSGIAYDGHAFSLTTANQERFEAGALAIATPANHAAMLLSAFPKIAGLLSQIRGVTIETIGVAVRKERTGLPPVAGIIAQDGPFYSAVSRDIVSHPDFRGFAFHFRPDILDENGRLDQICRVLGMNRGDIDFVATKMNRLPTARNGHGLLVGQLDQEIAGMPLMLTGNYFGGVSLEDCVSRSRHEFGRLTGQTADR